MPDKIPLTPDEKNLVNKITDKNLKESICALREAAIDIWDPSVRLLPGFTDHGISHSQRVAGKAAQLLNMNDKLLLSQQELYLLLAGIYMHDIGMQCDIAQFPEVKRKAEQMGAKFNIDFKANEFNKYNSEEQRLIRENHHFISAAWISYIFTSRNAKTLLANAISKIPMHLVSDLMEICKYHSKLPITNCLVASRNDPTIRVQFIAALLRFADELDTDKNRVSSSVLEYFKFDPFNAVYWWLHSLTIISFEPSNAIILKIILNNGDYARFCKAVYDNFILEFQTKNHSSILILRQNNIPVTISSESTVELDQNAKPLPEEIKNELIKITSKANQVNILAYEVRTWLRALSYEIDKIIFVEDDVMEMEASIDPSAFDQKILVVCYSRDLKIYDVDAILSRLNRELPNSLLISNKIINPKVSDYAYGKLGIRIFHINDFLQERIWNNYFNSLRSLVEKDKIHELYLDLGCYQEQIIEGTDPQITKYPSLDNFIDKWLRETGKTHISLLGEFGTGKTWFCRHYAIRQLSNFLRNPINERMPLLITLREFSKATTAKQLINDALIEQYGLPFKGSAFDIFKDLNRRGKLLLILDGFDEMARKVDLQTVVDNFWELASLVEMNSKIILTCRTEYFRMGRESEEILGGETYGRRIKKLSPPKFEILHVDALSDKQIRNLIALRKGEMKGDDNANIILSQPNLAEMARIPVLIELLLAALDEVSQKSDNVPQNISQVYLYATNKLILRNITTERTFLSTADKIYFLCELAWKMIRKDELSIHFSEIPEVIIQYFGSQIKAKGELDNWDYDLRNATLLHRDAYGNYEFAHKSLAEYFVAFKFVAELGCLSKEFKETYIEGDLHSADIPYKPLNIMELAKTFGSISLLDNTLFLK